MVALAQAALAVALAMIGRARGQSMHGDSAGSASTFRTLDRSLPQRVTFQCISSYSAAPTKESVEITSVGGSRQEQSGSNSEIGMRLMSFVRDNGWGINPEAVQNESD